MRAEILAAGLFSVARKRHAGVPQHSLYKAVVRHICVRVVRRRDYFFTKEALSSKKAGLPLGIITTRWRVVLASSLNV